MKKYAYLLDVEFEVVNNIRMDGNGKTNNLLAYYEKPSRRKCEIWEMWDDFFKKLNRDMMDVKWWINSRNFKIFTIGAVGETAGYRYHFWITPSHNYVTVEVL